MLTEARFRLQEADTLRDRLSVEVVSLREEARRHRVRCVAAGDCFGRRGGRYTHVVQAAVFRPAGGGVCTHFMYVGSRITMDPRIPTMLGWSTPGFLRTTQLSYASGAKCREVVGAGGSSWGWGGGGGWARRCFARGGMQAHRVGVVVIVLGGGGDGDYFFGALHWWYTSRGSGRVRLVRPDP